MSLKREIQFYIFSFAIVTIIVLVFFYQMINQIVLNQEISKATDISKTIYFYRKYLATIAPNVLIKNKNLSSFACTPAYATNQVLKMLDKQEKIEIRQVSDRYRNKADKPDKAELKAIEYFKNHKQAKMFYEIHNPDSKNDVIKNQKHIFYAYPLWTEKSCLKCHGVPYKDVPPKLYNVLVKNYGNRAFNYKLGELRGIISVVIPYKKVIDKVHQLSIIVLSILVILFMVGGVIFYFVYRKIEKDIGKFLVYFDEIGKSKKYRFIKSDMNYLKFNKLKNSINDTIKTLKAFQVELIQRLNLNPLTRLLSRNKFIEDVKKHKKPIAIFNIDGFREINDFYGIKIADEIIKLIAKRFSKLSKEYNFKLYHLSIDEFGVIFNNEYSTKEELINLLKNILNKIEKEYQYENNVINIKFRVGVSFFNKDYVRASIAVDYAKELKKDIVFGSEIEEMKDNYKQKREMFNKLKWALENDKIVPFYQGIVDRNKKIVKYEALVRIIDSEGNVISPFFFLDIAKKTRLYKEITKRVIQKSFERFNNLDVGVSVNLTLEDIESKEMREFVLEMLNNYNVNATIEIVESESVNKTEEINKFFEKIKQKSKLYIDDFGSGYANFDYLLRLGANGVKIDGSLVKDILTDKNSEIIVKLVIEFAKQTGIEVVAEFVENEEVFEKLKSLGVDYFQGYYFSKPSENLI